MKDAPWKYSGPLDHAKTHPNSIWRCQHGISNTYPCPTCFGFSERISERDRSRDWKEYWEHDIQ